MVARAEHPVPSLRDNLAARLEYAFAANDSNDSTRTYADNAYSMQLQYSF